MSDGTADSFTAFAPATVANVAVGFDVLGFALGGVGDRVTVRRDADSREVSVEILDGLVTDLPVEPERNTASVALLAMLEGRPRPHGFRVGVRKGIPLGSGMGGSAASAVGAVVAANRLLDRPFRTAELLPFAMAGERAASGAAHADNVAPCLYGGITAVVGNDPPAVVRLPVPAGVDCVLVHPHLRIDTREARNALRSELPLATHVAQSMRLCGFLAGLYRNDPELIGRSLVDLVAEPTRKALIPGFDEARAAALEAGALGFAIAGSGPSVFAWCVTEAAAAQVEQALRRAFERAGVASDAWRGPILERGAAVVADGD